ncbi:hypothetical protein FRC18_007555 [Serendipita sp. 400]|nr:hypothetical protein FRC18_007555 [Serendipita sp. 400]
MSHQQLSQPTPSTSNPTPKLTTPSPESAGDIIRRDLASLSSEHLSGPEGGTVALHTALVPPAESSDNSSMSLISAATDSLVERITADGTLTRLTRS